jgi:heme exporter protein CcmD
MNLAEFFAMDGYAVYVWPCYALTLIVLVGIVIGARRDLAAEQTRAIRRAQANKE